MSSSAFNNYVNVAIKAKYYAPSKVEFNAAIAAISKHLGLNHNIVIGIALSDPTIVRDVIEVAVKSRPLKSTDAAYKRMIYEVVECY